ncbi:hypothetical protein FAM09_20830 [Niastella caeni]|uniref:DUF1735 domain-containing protein n=1 Tax=Niastella caeni TaxID=2569763 RepID=A0A4S8HRX9_9BACT|nr:hypothetical protein [Niastella caeni]THU35842.1 hypothetical protein FAM09_20830 [Niastella caeni]
MKNKILPSLPVMLFTLFLSVFLGCRPEDYGGNETKESGKVYFPDEDGIVAALGNYSIDTVKNSISFPVTVYRGGFSDFAAFAVYAGADTTSIQALIQSGKLPANTVALDPSDYELATADTIAYTNGIMKGAITPKIKVANLSKYSGKYAALGVVVKYADKFEVNTSANKVVIYFPVDSLVSQVYFPGVTNGSNSVVALDDNSYTIDTITNTVNCSIPVLRGGIADLATSSATVTVDNSAIPGLISAGKLPSNTVALNAADYTFNNSVTMSDKNGMLQGTAMPKISIAKLSQYAGSVVALGLTITNSKFPIDANRNKIVVYFNADDILALFAPRVNLLADITKWVPVNLSWSNDVTATINTQAGSILYKGGNGNWNQAGVYQEVRLYGHRQYKIDMHVQGSGASNVWFEVWLSQKKPQDGQDVTTGWDPAAKMLLSLNTWLGCGVSPFNAQLSAISCNGNGGTITLPSGGTYYITVRGGGNDLGTTGITASAFDFK